MRLPYLCMAIFFLFSILCVSALDTYESIGTYDADFAAGDGIFNSKFDPSTQQQIYTRLVTDPKFVPLVSDLDNDQQNEIIILDGNNIEIYQGRELDLVDSIELDHDEYSYIEIYDIDGDDKNEIITINEDSGTINYIEIISYNGTHLNDDTTFQIESSSLNYKFTIKCEAENACVAVWGSSTVVSTAYVKARSFNSTGVISPITEIESIDTDPGGGWAYHQAVYCPSKIRTMSVDDIDNDGTSEYVFNFAEIYRSASPTGDATNLKTFILSISGSNINTESEFTEDNILELQDDNVESCDNGQYGNYYTSPSVYDYDGAFSNGQEILIGLMENSDEYKIYSYENDGDFARTFPNTYQGDGIIISNIMRANIFPDTDTEDFCVLGFQTDDNELDLLCGSMTTADTPQTREFKTKNETMENYLDINMSRYDILSHSAQYSSATTENSDLSEIVTSFGVFAVDWDTTYSLQLGANIFYLDQIYQFPKTRATVISADVEQIGLDDMIGLTESNIWYIDDGFVNNNALIDEYSINPDNDYVWQNGTKVGVSITPIDYDNDNVRAKAILYYGEDEEQDSGLSESVSSGTTIPFIFKAGNFTTNSILRLMAQDTRPEHNESFDIIDLPFRVSDDGIVFGDAIKTVTGISEDPTISDIDEEAEELSLTDNAFKDFVLDIEDVTGVPILLIFLAFLLIFDIFILSAAVRHILIGAIICILTNFMAFVFASLLGILPVAFVISMYALIIILGVGGLAYLANRIWRN